MAKVSSLYVKRATIAALNDAFAGVTTYPQEIPPDAPRPFHAYGAATGEPFGATCLDGMAYTVAVHSYTETTDAGGGEDEAHAMNAAVVALLDGATVDLTDHGCPYPATAHFSSTGDQVISDGGVQGKFHGIAGFRITVSS